MIRLLLYRLFWATYDYLGSVTLVGLGLVLLLLALLSLFVFDLPGMSQLHGVTATILFGLLVFCWLILSVHTVAHVGRAAALEERVPWREIFLPSPRQIFNTLPFILIAVLGILVLGLNIFFYASLARQSSGILGLAFLSLIVFFFYLLLCFLSYLLAFFGVWANTSGSKRFRDTLRDAFVNMVVLPKLWFFCLFLCLGGVVLAVLTILGFVFLLPVGGIIACVAARTVREYVENLSIARAELGEKHSLRRYQKHAEQLCLNAELQKGIRNLREIFKPWQY